MVELTPQQQATLAPLAQDWNTMDPARRRKWIGLAERYPRMSATQQAQTQSKMREWAQLTPDQRDAARKNTRRCAR